MSRLSRAVREFVTVLRTGRPSLDDDRMAYWIRIGREAERGNVAALYAKAGDAARMDAWGIAPGTLGGA